MRGDDLRHLDQQRDTGADDHGAADGHRSRVAAAVGHRGSGPVGADRWIRATRSPRSSAWRRCGPRSQTEVTSGDRDIANEIEAEIAKGRAAATFNRPAAADKVYRNLTALVQAYLTLA